MTKETIVYKILNNNNITTMIPINCTFFLLSFNEFQTESIFTIYFYILSRIDNSTTFQELRCWIWMRDVYRDVNAYNEIFLLIRQKFSRANVIE